MSNGGFLAARVYVYVYNDAGVVTGAIGPINNTKLAYTDPAPDKVERISSDPMSYGVALDAANINKPMTVSMGTDDVTAETLKLALRGTKTAYSQGALTASNVTVHMYHDLWVDTGKRGMTALTIAGSVLGTDYEVDLTHGFVKALSGGNLADDTDATCVITCPAYTGFDVNFGTVTSNTVKIVGVGLNLYDTSEKYEFAFWKVLLSSNDETQLAGTGNTPLAFNFTGTASKPLDKDGPMFLRKFS